MSSESAPVAYQPHRVSGVPPWDMRRWPQRPVPADKQVTPTLGQEGDGVLVDNTLTDNMIVHDSEGNIMEGTIFLGEGRVRRCMGPNGVSYRCDENGQGVNAKTVLRPPSKTAAQ